MCLCMSCSSTAIFYIEDCHCLVILNNEIYFTYEEKHIYSASVGIENIYSDDWFSPML